MSNHKRQLSTLDTNNGRSRRQRLSDTSSLLEEDEEAQFASEAERIEIDEPDGGSSRQQEQQPRRRVAIRPSTGTPGTPKKRSGKKKKVSARVGAVAFASGERPGDEDGEPEIKRLQSNLQSLVDNVFMPPRLPSKAPEKEAERDANTYLLKVLARAGEEFGRGLDDEDLDWWTPAQGNLKAVAALYQFDFEQTAISPDRLRDRLQIMNTGDFTTLFIRAQNAGVTIRVEETEVIFEMFEASPLAEAVSTCHGRLLCSFPGPRTTISRSIFKKKTFVEPLAEFLATMDSSQLENTDVRQQNEVNDAGSTHPMHITHLLTGMTRGLGDISRTKNARICKRIGDTVLGADKSPWRRSPMWLATRVGLHTTFRAQPARYKQFMAFFMSRMLAKAIEDKSIAHEYLSIMGAKIARRMEKLGGKVLPFLRNEVDVTLKALDSCMGADWRRFGNQGVRDALWTSTDLSVSADTNLKLSHSKPYIHRILNGKTDLSRAELENGDFHPTNSARLIDPIAKFPETAGLTRRELTILLMDVERWVERGLEAFVSQHIDSEDKDAVVALGRLHDKYFKLAVREYEDNPEQMSMAFLTGFDIWMAVDKLTTNITPLLKQYSPEVAWAGLNCLNLAGEKVMKRVEKIQTYIMNRESGCRQGAPKILKDKYKEDSFQVLYFDSSIFHEELLQKVQDGAQETRRAVRQNIKELGEEYVSMMQKYHSMECDYTDRGKHRRGKQCKKCNLQRKAQELNVVKHEWPLPEGPNEANLRKTIVFELACPTHFAAWRDVTFRMIVNTSAVLQFSETHPETQAQEKMATYAGLRDFYSSDRETGIIFATINKSQGGRFKVHFPIDDEEKEVFCENQLRYRYYYQGDDGGHWMKDFLALKGKWDQKRFSYDLPKHSLYKSLQFTLRKTSHTSNQILAIQYKCPPRLSLHEFYEYGTLRSGHLLQWLNIAKHLKSGILNLNRPEVSSLILQAAWECGPAVRSSPNLYLREVHRHFNRSKFTLELLLEVSRVLDTVRGNWLEIITMATLAGITLRCLALTKPDAQNTRARNEAKGVLEDIRGVLYSWIEDLRAKVNDELDQDALEDKLKYMMYTAAICRMTYEVPESEATQLVEGFRGGDRDNYQRDPSAISIFLETGAIIRDNMPPKREHVPEYFRIAIDRALRLSHRWEDRVRRSILEDQAGIDRAVEKQWQPHTRDGNWRFVGASGSPEYWAQTRTTPTIGGNQVQISVNILDGQILVNRTPFGRLPSEYTQNTTYDQLFGRNVLRVGPSTLQGMQYQTRFTVEGHQVHLGLHEGELIVRSRKNGVTYENIPASRLGEDLFKPLIDKYVHWVDLTTSIVHFRPLHSPWDTQKCDWTMTIRNDRSFIRRFGDPNEYVVEISSPTSRQLCGILEQLEGKDHILVTAKQNLGSESDYEVRAELERLNLMFASQGGILKCRTFPGFQVAEDQSLGCFYGLNHKLVLSRDKEKMVLIPFGTFRFSRFGHHSNVKIEGASSYQAYTVDARLGRLVGNGSITSRLFQIYLHAITSSSSCQVDSLTGRTGTEEAASLLFSGAVRSFQELTEKDIQLLHAIAKLTPYRALGISSNKPGAPRKGRVEVVRWEDELSFNVQRDIFRVGAEGIIKYWMKIKKFKPVGVDESGYVIDDNEIDEVDAAIEEGKKDAEIEKGVERGDEIILRRAAYRNERFYAFLASTWDIDEEPVEDEDGLMVATKESLKDISYTARDMTIIEEGDKEPKVVRITRQLISWRAGGQFPKIWDVFAQYTAAGVHGVSKGRSLEVDEWLLKGNAGDRWCTLFDLCRKSNKDNDLYRLVFVLSSFAFKQGVGTSLVQALVTAAIRQSFLDDAFKIPSGHFQIFASLEPEDSVMTGIISRYIKPYEISSFHSLPADRRETPALAEERRTRMYKEDVSIHRGTLLRIYKVNWALEDFDPPARQQFKLITSMAKLHKEMTEYFKKYRPAYKLNRIIENIQRSLNLLKVDVPKVPAYEFETNRTYQPSFKSDIDIFDLLTNCRAPRFQFLGDDLKPLSKAELCQNVSIVRPEVRHKQLQALLKNLSNVRTNPFQREYATTLKDSITALSNYQGIIGSQELPVTLDYLRNQVTRWQKRVNTMSKVFKNRLEPKNEDSPNIMAASEFYFKAGLWPRISNFILLRLLSHHTEDIPDDWTEAIVEFGVSITELNRAERLLKLAESGDFQGFWDALSETDKRSWDPKKYKDWLLLELENNFCIRDVQADIATEMISPQSGKSSVMQMNMGEGKSSVIIPAVAATLANTDQLVRVIVLKPLAREMFNLLRSKLGGLCSRRIFFLPFHRGLKLESQDTKLIEDIYRECLEEGGILLAQNEHLLSFKLLGLEKLCEGESIGQDLYETQQFLDDNCRDLLDESDEILRVNHTLIYTVGTQGPMQNQPYRWLSLLQVFDVVLSELPGILEKYPGGFEITDKPGDKASFPYLRILQLDAADALMKAVATELVYGNSRERQWFSTISEGSRKLILKFITEKDFSTEDANELANVPKGGDMWGAALLFRGLFAYDILRFCFQEKRWRVDYGADLSRTLLAVPYKAKDTPSSASDFAHPEVLLALTCISWYNYGLSDEDIANCLELIETTENPEDEYRQWIRNHHSLPDRLRNLKGVNVHNVNDFRDIFCPAVRFSKRVIDFFLANCVFPKHAKQFPFKLTSSGWDVVEERKHITSGFSGTNDNKWLLPLSIEQRDLPAHQHTNALVLNYLLMPENNHFLLAAKPGTREKMTVDELLDTIVGVQPPITVLLDVGAQVLELSNQEVASNWLGKTNSNSYVAAIFFNANDEICVIDRAGRIELLMTSSYAKQMSKCLCYLDDAHTRGTDLPFPLKTRALVTLGPRTTKDRFTQGVMRMRKLGKGHSVVFCAPPDIEAQILTLAKKGHRTVENNDVLKWALRETCRQTQKNAELWAAQGINYVERQEAITSFNSNHDHKALLECLFEPEKMSLEDLYDVKESTGETHVSRLSQANSVRGTALAKIADKCKLFSLDFKGEALEDLDEEQEREVEQEIEIEREIHRPPPVTPLDHTLHKDLINLVRNGTIPSQSTGFEPAIVSLRNTSIRKFIRPGSWSTKLLVTKDFAQSIDINDALQDGRQIDHQDEFVRPVSFILSVKQERKKLHLVVISPWEANRLFDEIKKSKKVHLHLYMPKVTKTMQSFENLKWLNIGEIYTTAWRVPTRLMNQLNIFAGQMYFRHKTAYLETARWLSLRTEEYDPTIDFQKDGFVPAGQRRLKDGRESKSYFKDSPIPCLQGLAAIRRKGNRYEPTHVGQLLHGKMLDDEDFEDVIDPDAEKVFDQWIDASGDEADDADFINEEVYPLARSAARSRAANQQPVDRMEVDNEDAEGEQVKEEAVDNMEEHEDEENIFYSGPEEEGAELDDGLPLTSVKQEPIGDDSELEDEIKNDLSDYLRDSSPIPASQGHGTTTLRYQPYSDEMDLDEDPDDW